jgi:hypothetical protein
MRHWSTEQRACGKHRAAHIRRIGACRACAKETGIMIKTVVTLSALLAAGSAGAVLAQEQVDPPAISGTVESVDPATRSVVLDNGQTYMMGDSAEIGTLQPGARVDLSCDTNGASCAVVSSSPQNDTGPESGTEPTAGPTPDGGGDSGTVPPGNTQPPDDSGMDSGGGGMGGGSGGSN